MGLNKKPKISQYWRTTSASQSTPWFRRMFSRNRFQLLLKFLHVVDNTNLPTRNQPGYNPAAKFMPVIDHLNMRSQYLYTPSRQLSVDESLIGTRSRTVMTQYIPTKHSKFGIKLWLLVEATTGYILQCIPYRGRRYDQAPPGEAFSNWIVRLLLSSANLLNKFYHVYCDSFFSSIQLATDLLRQNTYLTGTLRKNRPMPALIKNANLAPNQTVYMRKRDLLAVAFRDGTKKPVRLHTSYHSAKQARQGKPKCIVKYNKYMGGVDLNDMLTSFYSDNRKTVKLWKRIVFNLFQRYVINAYVLYTKNTSDRPVKSRLRFTEDIIDALAMEYKDFNAERRGNRLILLHAGRVKDCCVCSMPRGHNQQVGQRRRSRYQCTTCRRGVHVLCLPRHLLHCNEI